MTNKIKDMWQMTQDKLEKVASDLDHCTGTIICSKKAKEEFDEDRAELVREINIALKKIND